MIVLFHLCTKAIDWTCNDASRPDVPEGSSWCATDASIDETFKSVGECKSSPFCYICRPSTNTTCNAHGTKDCVNKQCICKHGYVGNYCDRCDFDKGYFVANSANEGKVDSVSGEGVYCSGTIKAFEELMLEQSLFPTQMMIMAFTYLTPL